MSKRIEFSSKARASLLAGVNKLSNAVTATLGPNGRNVIIEQSMGNPTSTKDGVTVEGYRVRRYNRKHGCTASKAGIY